ncbi:MAG: hypothetical protein JKX87_08245 [Cycloclasticus sp.]|nr:hypothetical protein [Cycloclasticus sp.]
MPKRIETTDELKILEDVENDKYHSLDSNEFDPMIAMLKTASDNTIERLTKKKAINIRLLESDIIRLKSMALNEGMPYQTYISHMIHKLTTGALKA